MAIDPLTGMEKMPKVIDVGMGDDQSSLLAPGLYAPNQPPPYDPASDKQNLFDTGQAGGSAYSRYGGTSSFPYPGGGQGAFAGILGQLLGGAANKTAGTMPGLPPVPSSPSPDLGPSDTGSAPAVGGDNSALSPALTAIMRGNEGTSGGSNIQAIMAQLLKSKPKKVTNTLTQTPGAPSSGILGKLGGVVGGAFR